MLAEYNVRPPQINASTITTGTKVILTASSCFELSVPYSGSFTVLWPEFISVVIINKCSLCL